MTGLLHMLENLFRKRFWVVNLLMITIVSFVFAAAGTRILAGFMAPYTITLPQASNDALEEADSEDPSGLQIANLLQDTSQLAEAAPEEVDEPDEAPDEEPEEDFLAAGDCVQAGIAAMLVGTMTDDSGSWSFGVVQDRTVNRTTIVRQGTDIAGATVMAVERDRVWVRYQGEDVCLKLGEEPGGTVVASNDDDSSSRRSSSRGRRDREDDSSSRTGRGSDDDDRSSRSRSSSSLRDGIRRVSPTEYEIQRDTINQALDNPRQLQAQAPEFQQAFDSGSPSGIRLTRIPSGSMFSAIGLRQGDVIQEVNGRRITTPQRAMDLYEALQNENNVELVVQRRGRQRTLSYTIE